MKIQVPRDALLKGCRLAHRALPDRGVGPAQDRFLLQAGADTCTLHAVGTDLALRLEMPSRVEECGEAWLPARRALAVVRQAADDQVALEASPGRVRARGQRAEFLLEVPGTAGPGAVPPFPAGPCHLLPPEPLCQAARRTLFAAGEQTSRYSLHGVLWEVEPDQVRLVATDSLRLAAAEVPAQGPDGEWAAARHLLPARAVDLLARVAGGQDQPVRAAFGERRAFFQAGPATVCARRLAGPFPDWRKAAPCRPRHLFPVPVGPFLAGVKQAAALGERGAARLQLRFEPGWVLLESRQAGAGQARVRLPLPLPGGRVEIALNPRFLAELLRAFAAEDTLLLGLTDADSPALFSDGDSYSHVLMPLRAA
jgi:DNA polymerase-3 subunit beta